MDSGSAAVTLKRFLDHLLQTSGLELEYTLEPGAAAASAPSGTGAAAATPFTAPGSPKSPEPGSLIPIDIAFSGPDVALLTAHSAELLHAVESIAAAILRLEPSEHHLLRFDAGGLRAARARWLAAAAQDAVARAIRTGRPVAFPPMNSRERRLLHLAVAPSGLRTASTGDGPRRSVVIYPPGQASPPAGAPPTDRPQTPFRSSAPQSTGHHSAADLGNRAPDGPVNSSSEADRIRAIRERFRSR